MACSCADWKICTCEAWDCPAHIEGCYVHSESCTLYNGGSDH